MTTPYAPRHNPWTIAMVVTLATFMEVLDTSIANVSLPHIAGNLSVTLDESTWILTSYLVANAVVLPLSGWLAGLFGRKRFYMTCVVLFTGSSLLCGFAPSLGTLIVCRVVQGAGGGGLQPSEQAILADTFPPEKRGMAFAVYGMAVVLAPAIGPTLGGYITDNFSWRWIFFINVPVGIASLILTRRVVEDPPWARARGDAIRVDWIGLSLIVLALGTLQIMLDKGEREDWFASPLITACAVTAAVALSAALAWEWRTPRAVIDVHLFGNRNFALACLMMFMLGAVLFGSTVLLPQYLQVLMGYSAQQAGEVLSPGGLTVILLLPLVGRLLLKVDGRWLIGFGFVASAVALFHMSHGLNLEIDFGSAVRYRVYQSVGLAFLFVPISAIAYVDVPREKNNQVSAIMNLSRNLGGSVGISLAITWIARRSQFHHARLAELIPNDDPELRHALLALRRSLAPLVGDDAPRTAYGVIARAVQAQAAAMAFIDVIWLLAILSACLVPLTLLLKKSRPGAPAVAH